MLQLIVAIILLISLAGLIVIVVRKLPALVVLPQTGVMGIKDHKIILKLREVIKQKLVIFEKQIFIQKILSWIKVITLKIETKVDKMLHGIRQKNKPG